MGGNGSTHIHSKRRGQRKAALTLDIARIGGYLQFCQAALATVLIVQPSLLDQRNQSVAKR